MSDPNMTPERPPAGDPRGARNITWIIVAILVVVAVVWYVMRGDNTPPPAEVPATTEAPAAIDAAPVETMPAETTPAETADEPADTDAEAPAEGETTTN